MTPREHLDDLYGRATEYLDQNPGLPVEERCALRIAQREIRNALALLGCLEERRNQRWDALLNYAPCEAAP